MTFRYVADDDSGLNVGTGHGIYQGNIHGRTLLFRNILTGIDLTINSGSANISISGSSSGVSGTLQPGLFNNRIRWMGAQGFSSITSSFNFRTFNTGTLNARTITTTNITTLSERIGFDTDPTADAMAGCRLITTDVIRGFLSGSIQLGGFHYSALFSVPTYTTASRASIGLFTTASINQSSSILTRRPTNLD